MQVYKVNCHFDFISLSIYPLLNEAYLIDDAKNILSLKEVLDLSKYTPSSLKNKLRTILTFK